MTWALAYLAIGAVFWFLVHREREWGEDPLTPWVGAALWPLLAFALALDLAAAIVDRCRR